mmetsp:Transcript_25731/g.77702  ORF Transcript_25731/g.77702 Transcript_25731/m.77702 type:complete len:214 (+) Transcript_25731:74-715(+)
MPLMSRPRAATSVATRTFRRPSFKPLRAASRSRCPLSPWMAPQGTRLRSSDCASWSHILFVEQKTRPFAALLLWSATPAFCRICMRTEFFSLPRHVQTICVMSWLPLSSSRLPICTCKASCRNSEARRRMAGGQVAVKKSVCRCRGTRARILRICGSKPMSSMRSASSSTSLLMLSSRTCLPSRKSFSLPGVAMRQWHPLRMADSCMCFGDPP